MASLRATPSATPIAAPPSKKADLGTWVGIVLAGGGILGGLRLEGGRLTDVLQYTAAIIVVAGTAGAVMVTTPPALLVAALKRIKDVLWDRTPSTAAATAQLLEFARQARRTGIVSLESSVERLSDPFFKKALLLAVDGMDLQDLRRVMELEIEMAERRAEAEAKVFETAGGYAPTIGIIGAVLGLIQVMKHLEDIERVGHGIAVAFVATVYGVGLANLVLLPMGNKLKARLERAAHFKEMVLEGVIGIAEGMNPKLIESKLEAFIDESGAEKKRRGKEPARSAAASSLSPGGAR
jgi:chemotaxis protein MotA